MSWSGGVRCSSRLPPHSASLRLLLGFTQLFSRVIKIFWYTGPLCIHRETHHVCCFLFYIYCNGYSLLLNSHQGRIGKIKIPQCCHCGHLTANIFHFILYCPLRTFCAARSLATPFAIRCLVQVFWSFWFLELHGFLLCSHSGNDSNNSHNAVRSIQTAVSQTLAF